MNVTVSRRAMLATAAALGGLGACSSDGVAPVARPASDPLGELDATGLAALVRAREISAGEALEAAIARTERLNPQLNFMAVEAYDYGRARAGAPLSGPFAGVPTLIKDLMPVTGLGAHYGSRAFANNVATEQPPYVDALLAAGLVPFGKSTTPEFGITPTTEPLLGGPTRNPWDVSRSSGGSSGGAAVAVACGAVPVAHASDGGGSIRIPASCNGLFGLKVSRNREMSEPRDIGGLSLSVSGCVSRSVRDSAAWLAVTERRGANAAFAPIGVVTGPSQRRLRIAFAPNDALGRAPDPEVAAGLQEVAELCRSLGHDVRERHFEMDGEAFSNAFIVLWSAGAAEAVAQVAEAAPNVALNQVLEPLTLDMARHFRELPADAMETTLLRLRELDAAYDAFFADVDVLLTPVLAKPPVALGEVAPTLLLDEWFARARDYAGYTPLQNVAGAPAMSVPLAWSSGGLPIGAHFSAAKGAERLLLELAYELELARPWAGRRPSVSAG